MSNLYDLVLEYNRATKEITKRIELEWFYDRYANGGQGEWRPPYGGYDELANQFTPYVVVRKKHDDPKVSQWDNGKYQGDFDSIKVGDVITDEMVAASYMLAPSTARSDEFVKLKNQVDFYDLLGGPQPNLKRYLASAWVYGYITVPHIDSAVNKGLITQVDAEDIKGIRAQQYTGVPIV